MNTRLLWVPPLIALTGALSARHPLTGLLALGWTSLAVGAVARTGRLSALPGLSAPDRARPAWWRRLWATWMRGVHAFLGAAVVLAPPSALMAMGWSLGWVLSFERADSERAFCFGLLLLGMIGLGWVLYRLPLGFVRFSLTGRMAAFWDYPDLRRRRARAPLRHAVVVGLTAVASIPLAVLKLPRLRPEGVGPVLLLLFCGVFALRLLWARALGDIARVPLSSAAVTATQQTVTTTQRLGGWLAVAIAVSACTGSVLLVVAAQFISWRGVGSFFDHALYLVVGL